MAEAERWMVTSAEWVQLRVGDWPGRMVVVEYDEVVVAAEWMVAAAVMAEAGVPKAARWPLQWAH